MGKEINKRFTIEYRDNISEFLEKLISLCEQCKGTEKIKHDAEQMMLHLEEYTEEH